MSHATDYDALTAAGARLGVPGGRDFILDHENEIVEAHGQEAFDDLWDVASKNDVSAARRLADRIAPFGEFETSPLRGGVAVDYSGPGIANRATFRSPDEAVAIAATAVALREHALKTPYGARILRDEAAAAEMRSDGAAYGR
jgi:hypothetical protein